MLPIFFVFVVHKKIYYYTINASSVARKKSGSKLNTNAINIITNKLFCAINEKVSQHFYQSKLFIKVLLKVALFFRA